MEQVNEIGVKIAESVVQFFALEENKTTVKRLEDFGVQLSMTEEELEGQTELLKGNSIVVTGVFELVSRTALKKLIEDNGGKVSSSISSKTSFIVAGDKMGPSKKEKAEKLGITLLSEKAFLDKIGYQI